MGARRRSQALDDRLGRVAVDAVDEQSCATAATGGSSSSLGRVHLRIAASAGPCRRAASRAPGTARWRARRPRRRRRSTSIAITTGRPCSSAGRNGIGGAGMTLAIVESSSGAASAAATKPAITRPSPGGPASRRRSRRPLQPELKPRHDAEVAAAAADRPEEVRVAARRPRGRLAVGGDHLGGEQVVDRQAVLADEEADAAAQRDAADADRAGVAEAGRQPVLRRRRRVLARGQAGLGPRGAAARRRCRAPASRPGRARCPPSDDAVAGALWPPPRTASSQPGLARERDDASDVGRVRDPDDRGRAAVDPAEKTARARRTRSSGVMTPALDVVCEAWDREQTSR